MKNTLLHVFRNSPMGRENLMQSAFFCKQHFGLALAIYVPQKTEFCIDLGADRFIVQLDASYTQYSSTAHRHAEEILSEFGCAHQFFEPRELAAGNLPLLPAEWALMTCPRVISERSSRIGLGHIGSKVRGLVKRAPFPVFIPSPAYKPWTSVRAFFGGSALGATAVKEGMAIARLSRVPMVVHTQLEGITRDDCEKTLSEAGILNAVSTGNVTWRIFQDGSLLENLYDVGHDALVVIGAAGHSLIKELAFGSKLEAIQSTLPNPFVVVGPECHTPWEALPEA